MKNLFFGILTLITFTQILGQDLMTPENLWKLGRITPLGLSEDGLTIYYKVTNFQVNENKKTATFYQISTSGGSPKVISESEVKLRDKNVSPDGQYKIYSNLVKLKNVSGADYYPELKESNAYIFDQLHYRHWDSWEDGKYGHIFLAKNKVDGSSENGKDLMFGEPYDCPQKPFGNEDDFIWSPDSKKIIYVCKKKWGTDYATSTNTDLYAYDLTTEQTVNLSSDMPGYDMHPCYSPAGQLSWLSMKRDGYEADKNDIIVLHQGKKINLTSSWDGTVDQFVWSKDGKKIYFIAATDGTKQIFELEVSLGSPSQIRKISSGVFDLSQIIGITEKEIIVMRNDMNHAPEIYKLDLKSTKTEALTHVNDAMYQNIKLCKTEKRMVKTTDGKEMLVWVVYPPDFEISKKYPVILYCQGGPQSALTQFYSYRWNLQTMASQGYIVVAPNRRGMPGHGVAWNEEISKNWGGQCMNDYLSAVDNILAEPFADKSKVACVGASFGGYSSFYLAGNHGGRFKTFIAHCGIFNLKSMYGTTEEVFFSNWDMGGPYWDNKNDKMYEDYNPINHVNKWDRPIMIIHGGKDYRVPYTQGMEAFQAAQLKGIKSRFLYLPDENHWVLNAQNALIWQREFFRWLKETLD